MNPKNEHYKDFKFVKRWERIEDSHFLISLEVSEYIRKIEDQLKHLNARYMSEFKQYKRSQIAEIKEVTPAEIDFFKKEGYVKAQGVDIEVEVSISPADKKAGSPKLGDMIGRNPKNHEDQWLIAEQYFNDNFEEITIIGK